MFVYNAAVFLVMQCNQQLAW